jgi:hypothetical protein
MDIVERTHQMAKKEHSTREKPNTNSKHGTPKWGTADSD